MEITLSIVLAVVWFVTVMYADAGLGYKGSAAPSIGPGLGAAIAIIIATVGALVSLVLMGVLLLRFGMRWPIAACAAFVPVPWLARRMRRGIEKLFRRRSGS